MGAGIFVLGIGASFLLAIALGKEAALFVLAIMAVFILFPSKSAEDRRDGNDGQKGGKDRTKDGDTGSDKS